MIRYDIPNDAAEWASASYVDNPVDHLEPEVFAVNSYREAAIRMIVVLEAADTFMTGARDARMAWTQISIALGLNSTRGQSETQLPIK